jgi:hypothetical protein
MSIPRQVVLTGRSLEDASQQWIEKIRGKLASLGDLDNGFGCIRHPSHIRHVLTNESNSGGIRGVAMMDLRSNRTDSPAIVAGLGLYQSQRDSSWRAKDSLYTAVVTAAMSASGTDGKRISVDDHQPFAQKMIGSDRTSFNRREIVLGCFRA